MKALPEIPNMWGARGALNAPKPDENPSGMRGNRDEAMTSTYINLISELNPIT
ncbi:MAG: hypothetical protein QXJ64_04595 [Thermosphaera sp.]